MATGNPKSKWNGSALSSSTSGSIASCEDVKLTYFGKKSVAEILNTESVQSQLIWSPHPAIPQNRLYFGENLSILKALLSDQSVKGHVRLIYIDPPFATKMVYQSRRLSNAYTDLLYGAHYIEFLRERLILLRELLAENGFYLYTSRREYGVSYKDHYG